MPSQLNEKCKDKKKTENGWSVDDGRKLFEEEFMIYPVIRSDRRPRSSRAKSVRSRTSSSAVVPPGVNYDGLILFSLKLKTKQKIDLGVKRILINHFSF